MSACRDAGMGGVGWGGGWGRKGSQVVGVRVWAKGHELLFPHTCLCACMFV